MNMLKLFCLFKHKYAVVEEYGNIIRLRCIRCGKKDAVLTNGNHKTKIAGSPKRNGSARRTKRANGG